MKKIIKLGVVLMCFLFSIGGANARCNPFKPSTLTPSRKTPPRAATIPMPSPGGITNPGLKIGEMFNGNGSSKTYNGRSVRNFPNNGGGGGGCAPRPGTLAVDPQGGGC